MVAVLSPNPISLRRAGDAASILPGPAEYPPRPSDAGAIPDAGGFDRPDRTPPAPSAPAARKVAGQASPPVRRDPCRMSRAGPRARKSGRGLVRGLMRKGIVAADALAAFFPVTLGLVQTVDGERGRHAELLPPRPGRVVASATGWGRLGRVARIEAGEVVDRSPAPPTRLRLRLSHPPQNGEGEA